MSSRTSRLISSMLAILFVQCTCRILL